MTRIVIGSALTMALIATAACSGSSPSAPSTASPASSTSASAFQAQTFSTTTASLGTLSHDHGTDADDHHGDGNGREAQLEGAIVSIDAAHKTFVVRTTTVNVLATTMIRSGDTTLAFADLTAGDQVHVKGAANGTAIDAREVTVQRPETETDDNHDNHEADDGKD